jgi:hypothetical protein
MAIGGFEVDGSQMGGQMNIGHDWLHRTTLDTVSSSRPILEVWHADLAADRTPYAEIVLSYVAAVAVTEGMVSAA